jgi:hypothetical protein
VISPQGRIASQSLRLREDSSVFEGLADLAELNCLMEMLDLNQICAMGCFSFP